MGVDGINGRDGRERGLSRYRDIDITRYRQGSIESNWGIMGADWINGSYGIDGRKGDFVSYEQGDGREDWEC